MQCSKSQHRRPRPIPSTRAHENARPHRHTSPVRTRVIHPDERRSAHECCKRPCSYDVRERFPCCREPTLQCSNSATFETCSSDPNVVDPCAPEFSAPSAHPHVEVLDGGPRAALAPIDPVPVLVSAAPVDLLPGSGALFCVVFFLAVMFVAGVVVQVYLTHAKSYHDHFLVRFHDYEGVDPPKRRTEPAGSTGATVPWKTNPRSGSSASRRLHARWKTAESSRPDDDRLDVGGSAAATPPHELLRDYPLLLPRDYQGESKSICMFHATGAGRRRNGVHYKPWNFPYHLCTHAVYCCAGVSDDLEVISRHVDIDVTQGFLASFAAMKVKNPYLRVYIGLGSDDKDRTSFAKIVASVGTRQQFAQNAVTWMRRAQYDGLVVYWRYPFVEQKAKLVDTMRYMRQALRGMGLTVAIVVPLDEMLRDRFNVSELSKSLDDYTIIIDPIDTQGPSYDSTFVPFRDGTVRMYAGVFMSTLRSSRVGGDKTSDGRFQLCYMLPVNAVSFTLERADQTEINAPTVGPGEPGPSTETPGSLAYDEVCSQRWETTRRVNYGLVSTRGNQWVVYQNRSSLHELLKALAYVTGPAKCFGIWDPFWDDFAGACGEGPYPLTRAVFARVVGHKIPFQKKLNLL
ncbi:hypothetical protein MRX96_011321 [Rhipicephalus microplus]